MARTVAIALYCLLAMSLLHSNAVAVSPGSEPETLGQLVTQATVSSAVDIEASGNNGSNQEKEAQRQAAIDRNAERLARLRKPLSEIRLAVVDRESQRPENLADEFLGNQEERIMSDSGLSISAPDRYTVSSYHRPLYFEELNLERCGNTYGCATNVVSAFYFLTNTAALPYRLATQRADCPVPSHGDCKTCQSYSHDIEPFGFEPRGALVEAAAIAGFVFLAM